MASWCCLSTAMAATRFTMLRGTGGKMGSIFGTKRWMHYVPQSPPLAGSIEHGIPSIQFVLPEFSSPSFSFRGGSMELMAVPKRKVTPHKKGLRNGTKALKPIPVIIRCKICGRVKLPHFFCCSGNKSNTGEQNGSSTSS